MVVSIDKQPINPMDNPVLPQLEMLQKMIDIKVSHLKDLRDKQNDNKSNVITSEISDNEVRYLSVLYNSILFAVSFLVVFLHKKH